jgi:hypothetical protein
VERAVTDKSGHVDFWLDAPKGFDPNQDYRVVVRLLPVLGVGPEQTEHTFRFLK